MKTVAVSGGFDPIHPGHLHLIREAANIAGLDGQVLVILNNDNWVRRKKGYVFMNQEDRRETLLALLDVDDVVFTHHKDSPDEDMSVAPELRMYHPDIFVNGGDRNMYGEARNAHTRLDNVAIPQSEKDVCDELGIQMIFNVGGEKYASSSELVATACQYVNLYERPWGGYKVHEEEDGWALKTLQFLPNEETSLQSHEKRDEYWFLVEGSAKVDLGDAGEFDMVPFISHVMVNRTAKHRIKAGPQGAVIVEVMRGEYDENDITRFDDKYGR